jgi:hypothetical protein
VRGNGEGEGRVGSSNKSRRDRKLLVLVDTYRETNSPTHLGEIPVLSGTRGCFAEAEARLPNPIMFEALGRLSPGSGTFPFFASFRTRALPSPPTPNYPAILASQLAPLPPALLNHTPTLVLRRVYEDSTKILLSSATRGCHSTAYFTCEADFVTWHCVCRLNDE